MVSSTTPRFGPRWPPVWLRVSMSVWRIFSASSGSFSSGRALRSAGEVMAGSSVSTGLKKSNFTAFGFGGFTAAGGRAGLFGVFGALVVISGIVKWCERGFATF